MFFDRVHGSCKSFIIKNERHCDATPYVATSTAEATCINYVVRAQQGQFTEPFPDIECKSPPWRLGLYRSFSHAEPLLKMTMFF